MDDLLIKINIAEQTLALIDRGRIVFSSLISSAKNGVGEKFGSYQTPRGWHVIRAKIGHGHEHNAVFVRRRATGEVYNKELALQHNNRDWILTRILWLSGMEVGKNRLGSVDTMRRFIYIHGTADEHKLGMPCSHGCIRMANDKIIELFEMVKVGTRVYVS